MTERPRQVHLAAHFPGVNNTTVWSDPEAGSHIEFSSFVKLAQTAERAKFDFFFLAEGLRLREQRGRIHDLDVVGRPDTFTVLAGLAAVTEQIGLSGTINSTFNEPYEVARQFASLDHLSGGRAGLERRHVVGRFHRGELPAGWVPRPRGPVRPRQGVPRHRARALGLVGRGGDHRRQGDRAVHHRPERGGLRPPRDASSTSRGVSAFPAHPRAIRSSSRPATPTPVESSPPPTPTASSPGTGRSRPGSASTRM